MFKIPPEVRFAARGAAFHSAEPADEILICGRGACRYTQRTRPHTKAVSHFDGQFVSHWRVRRDALTSQRERLQSVYLAGETTAIARDWLILEQGREHFRFAIAGCLKVV